MHKKREKTDTSLSVKNNNNNICSHENKHHIHFVHYLGSDFEPFGYLIKIKKKKFIIMHRFIVKKEKNYA